MGAYSLARPGQMYSRDELAKPVEGKLFFAGEATIPAHSGTVHGAYLSGQRVAEEVEAVLLAG